ncbi:hypothetical protein M433DRAFT_153946 [Acidomyces richmondensis BFW]|nr:MAG: hypothetical protein FE78DRAFT_89862 [Acidomyces sp. 'richmondensis']KYG45945.1 hypothetical protein M433DRAFT_153946 [Acidomyces richmondensis BFW]
MAEARAYEASRSLHSATPAASQPEGDALVENASGTKSHRMTPTSFLAVNSRAVLENATRSGDATPLDPSQSGSTPTVAPSRSQTPRPSASVQSAPAEPNGVDGVMTETATYGTRSRNRMGNARPNYAEDQDMDFEISTTAATKKKASQESGLPTPSAAEAKRAEDFTRLVVGHSKETTPASSNAPAPSKKRKTVGSTPQQSNTTPTATTPVTSALRKTALSAISAGTRETNVMTFTKHKSCLNKKGELVADDGTKLSVNDHVYLVCEPPGDPYYLCRIMEFLHVDSENPNSPVDSIRVNWYYRPRDVQRFNSDSRLVYATMHSDMCPITSLRGKCQIKHKSEIDDLDAYRKKRDSFYFSQVFDRFIRRWYECIPVAQIINVPEKVKKALDERWSFVVVETGRVKELTSAVKTCKRCTKYCASHDSVDCAICKNSYHMNCVQPPLPKKPSRGFAWACGPCSRASEKKMEARNTPTVSGDVTDAEDECIEEDPPVSNDSTRAPSPSGDDIAIDLHPATQAEIALAKMWPMRYLGIHCRVEDALQYDDRAIYPRASSRLGPRHQANVNVWHGRPVELVKAAEIRKRYSKNGSSHKKDGKLARDSMAAFEADREEKLKRPKWVQDEPPGYVARGEDYPNDDPRCTAKLLFKMPEEGSPAEKEKLVDDYIKEAKKYSKVIGVPPFGVNFLDKAIELLTASNYNASVACKKLEKIDRKKDLHEPVLTKAELTKFEEGVAKYGSEHRSIRLHMKTNLPNSDIVRFYYLWKKTPKGKEIWGNYGGRKGSKRKVDNDAGAKLQAEVSNDADDSAFDNEKASRRGRGFICKFCNTMHSRQWRRAPGVSPGQTVLADARNGQKDKKERLLLALCLRCAGLWRKYAIQWEDIDDVAKKVAQGGGRAWKRKIDEELLRELVAANEAANMSGQELNGAFPSIEQPGEPPKKKSKVDASVTVQVEPPKKKEKPPPPPKEPTPPPPPIIPNPPQWRVLPCAVCMNQGDTIECSHCKLTVHRQCFGLGENDGIRADGTLNWICEQCQNDRHPEVSTDYSCCLCTTEHSDIELVEPPKVSHKKKTDREREKEQMEKELVKEMKAQYVAKQRAQNRPIAPREPLKRTAGNNWVHVNCAVWTPEIRFSNAKKLEVAEGFQLLPPARYEAVCKLCKNKDDNQKVIEDAGACVSCFQCHANFHVSCALRMGYQFGFDVTPVKGSRKDQITTVTLGEETGSLTAGIWCKEHVVKTIIHPMNEIVNDTGKNALQVFVENYKQADLTLTGTVRKANLAQLTKEKGQQTASSLQNGRRESTANSIAAAVRRGARTSSFAENKSEAGDGATHISDETATQTERRCVKCKVDVTPRWHPLIKQLDQPREPTPPLLSPPRRRLSMTLGEIADLERQRSQEAVRSNATVDITGAPVNRPPMDSTRLAQNIRFMPPGANGRAWDGMPDRFATRPTTNGDVRPNEQPLTNPPVIPSRETDPLETNGEPRPPEEGKMDEGFHNHVLPRYQNPASAVTPPPDQEGKKVLQGQQEWLCHKCFIKKKIDPTPTPPPKPAEPAFSPPRRFPLQLDWAGPPLSQPPRDGPIRMPWDDPPRQSQPPPHMNGIGPHPPTFGSHATSQGSGYPPYVSQPNGYPPPPQHHGAPAHGPPIHERQPSYPYGLPPVSGPSQYGSHPPPRPTTMTGFQSAGPPMANGVHSSHGGHSQLQSPTYPPGMPQQHVQYPRRTESPFTSQLPPIGQPLHSSPQSMFNRPDALTHAPPPPPPTHQHTSQPQPLPHHHPAAQSQLPTRAEQPQSSSPNMGQSWPDGQQGRPTTPRDGAQSNCTPGPGGASASPSLRNLLH